MSGSTGADLQPTQVLEVAQRLTRDVGLCVLTTTGADDWIHARVMQPFPVDPDLTLWFGTSPSSRKIADMAHDAQATATFQSADGSAYASLSGRVGLVDDLETRRRLWRSDWTQYFPAGPDDGYILMRLVPDRIEVLDFANGVAPPPYGAVPAAVVRSDGEWAITHDA